MSTSWYRKRRPAVERHEWAAYGPLCGDRMGYEEFIIDLRSLKTLLGKHLENSTTVDGRSADTKHVNDLTAK